jgi:CelD/BcsL family acetyltransferase involved in cellulose biosynthesis
MFSSEDRLLGLAPLSIEQCRTMGLRGIRLVRLMGDGSTDSDNLDLIVLPGLESRLICAILDYLESNRSRWNAVEFNTLSDESSIRLPLLNELKRRKWSFSVRRQLGIVADLGDNWDSFLGGLSPRRRRLVRKYVRTLEERADLRIRRCEPGPSLTRDLFTFFGLHQGRWTAVGEPGTFAARQRREFYLELAQSLTSRGWLEFWLLEVNGQPAAAQFDFRYRNTVYRLQSGYDPAHAAERLGHLLLWCVLRRYIAAGVRHYDFLAGAELYKQELNGRLRYYYNIHFAPTRSIGRMYISLTAMMSTAKSFIRPHLPRWLLSAVHRFRQRS